MIRFLSEEAINLHKEYMKDELLRFSVYEICYPEIKNKSLREIYKMRLREKREEIIKIKSNLLLHNVYFSSFKNRYEASRIVRNEYGSEASFLYEVYKIANVGESCLIIYTDGKGIKISKDREAYDALKYYEPILCLDLCEHAYFPDYGFNKQMYIENSISYLNLNKIDEKMSVNH